MEQNSWLLYVMTNGGSSTTNALFIITCDGALLYGDSNTICKVRGAASTPHPNCFAVKFRYNL